MTRLRNINKPDDLTDHEKRILQYLAKNGETNRRKMVIALAAAGTNTAERITNGANGAVPLLAAKWCRRLLKSRLVVDKRDGDANHIAFKILPAGRALINQ
jgi:hypothetical protein